jgi:hypothetical protein
MVVDQVTRIWLSEARSLKAAMCGGGGTTGGRPRTRAPRPGAAAGGGPGGASSQCQCAASKVACQWGPSRPGPHSLRTARLGPDWQSRRQGPARRPAGAAWLQSRRAVAGWPTFTRAARRPALRLCPNPRRWRPAAAGTPIIESCQCQCQ